MAKKVLELDSQATEAPWAWESFESGYVVGTVTREDGTLIDGEFSESDDGDPMLDEQVLEYSMIGTNESAPCNLSNPELITFYRNAAPLLARALLNK